LRPAALETITKGGEWWRLRTRKEEEKVLNPRERKLENIVKGKLNAKAIGIGRG